MISNIENKIKLALIVSITSIISSVVISIYSIIRAYSIPTEAYHHIYVLDRNNYPFNAKLTTQDIGLELIRKGTIETFHKLFLTLPPDDRFIKETLDKSMYLIDESGVRQRNTLTEKGFYSDILSSSSFFSISCDSIQLKEDMSFIYYGTQRIDRKSNITYRELITMGKLIESPITGNNPYGYTITNYKTISNKDK